ncbi:MAG: hypothetical protein AAFY31_18850 [Pseudomonadota bacterium]
MSDALEVALATNNLRRVIDIYTSAAAERRRAGDINAACFLLTQGWIFALEADDPRAADIRAELILLGRETEE